jgi:hypothetical protein
MTQRGGRSALTVCDSYFQAESRRDLEAVVALYDVDATYVHPDGSRSDGAAAIRAFYASVFGRLEAIDVRRVDAVGGPDRAAVEWRAVVVDGAGTVRHLRGVNVVAVKDARFTEVRAYFGEAVGTTAGSRPDEEHRR